MSSFCSSPTAQALGKSTLFELINKLLGDYSHTTSSCSSATISPSCEMEAVGELKGTRLALASESDGSKRFNETVLKRLTYMTIQGTKLQQTAFEFKPEFKIWMRRTTCPSRDGSMASGVGSRLCPCSPVTTEEIDNTSRQLEAKQRVLGGWSKEL